MPQQSVILRPSQLGTSQAQDIYHIPGRLASIVTTVVTSSMTPSTENRTVGGIEILASPTR
jgi:hypothetical protein